LFIGCEAFIAGESVCKNFFTAVLGGVNPALVVTRVRKNIESDLNWLSFSCVLHFVELGRNFFSFVVIFFKFIFQLIILLEIFLQDIPNDIALIGSNLNFFVVKLDSSLQLFILNFQIVNAEFNFVCVTSILVHSLLVKRFKFCY